MRLLVIDDKEGFREQLGQIFAHEGFEVASVASGNEAVGALESFAPDIVLTDIVMPNGDGFHVLEHVQEQGYHCPVVVITAYGSQQSAVKALRLGAYDYITKPFDLDVILAVVNRAAEYRRLQLEVAQRRKERTARLAELQRSHQEIDALQDLTAAIQSSLELSEVLDRIVDGVVHGLGYRAAMVAVYDAGKDALVIESAVIDQEVWAEGEQLVGMSLIGSYLTMDQEENLAIRSAKQGEMSVTHDLYDLFRPAVDRETAQVLQQMAGVRTMVTAPLRANGKLVGNFFAGTHREGLDGAEHLSLRAFARQAALAIEHARLYAETEQSLREQEYLHEIGRAFNSTLDLEQVLTLVMAKTNELLGVEAGSVALLTPEGDELVFHASVGGGADAVRGLRMPVEKGIVGWVIQNGVSLLVPDVAQDPRHYAQVDDQSGFKTRSILCVPLVSKGRVIGAIEVLNKIKGRFEADDLRMTEALAYSAATAIENAQLFQREKQALERLKQAQDELVRAQRLALLAQIGVTVRHEVNNPLTAVLGNADWLLQVLSDLEEEPRKALEAIRANALRIRDLVNKLEAIKSDRVTEYVEGIEMLDLYDQDQEGEPGGTPE